MKSTLLLAAAFGTLLHLSSYAQANDASATEDNGQPRELLEQRQAADKQKEDPPPAPDTVEKAVELLHADNLKEIHCGKLAIEEG